MNYHSIFYDDMKNGDGLRVVLFVSGCSHNCPGCHNPDTHDPNSGIPFDEEALNRIDKHMSKPHTSGITLSGGDPLYESNLEDINKLIDYIRDKYPDKTIWLYTGYNFNALMYLKNPSKNTMLRRNIIKKCDIIVDGLFKMDKRDANYPWAGSTNQRVIDVKKSIEENKVVLHTYKNIEEITNKYLFG